MFFNYISQIFVGIVISSFKRLSVLPEEVPRFCSYCSLQAMMFFLCIIVWWNVGVRWVVILFDLLNLTIGAVCCRVGRRGRDFCVSCLCSFVFVCVSILGFIKLFSTLGPIAFSPRFWLTEHYFHLLRVIERVDPFFK